MIDDLSLPMVRCLGQICEGKIFIHKASADALVRRGLATNTEWRYTPTEKGRVQHRRQKRQVLHSDIGFIRAARETSRMPGVVPSVNMYRDLAEAALRVANALVPLIGEEKA
jgi:hypothetical protein